jgi:hypothetical protein
MLARREAAAASSTSIVILCVSVSPWLFSFLLNEMDQQSVAQLRLAPG